MKLRSMLQCAIFAALLCIFSPLAIPLGPVPLSLWLFGAMLCAVVLPWKQSLLSVFLFLLLSLCGLPVFSGGHSGLTALPGPTGGYVWSALLFCPLISLLAQRTEDKPIALARAILSCFAALPICYFFGTLQFSLVSGRSFSESLSICVLPFLLPDLVKAICAALLGVPVRGLLAKQRS